jgi:tRNA(Glu) U13 pseudouridine synthase TruD
MNDIKDKIDELKQMQKFPNYYLSQYFGELKAQVDTKYALKEDERDKYLEIITNIESFEQNVYKKWSSKSINTYDNEIKSIEDQLIAKQSILTSSISLVIALTKITKLIDEVKYKI